MRVRVSCGRTRGRAVVLSASRSYVMPRGRTLEPGYRTTTSEKVRPRRVGYDRAREGTTGREKVRPRGAARVVRAASGNGGPCASPPSGGFCADSPVEPRVRTSPRRRRTDLAAEVNRSRCGTEPISAGADCLPSTAPLPGYDRARGAGLSLPARGPMSSRGSHPGFPHPGEHILLRRSDRSGLPKTRLDLGDGPLNGFPNPHDPSRPTAVTM